MTNVNVNQTMEMVSDNKVDCNDFKIKYLDLATKTPVKIGFDDIQEAMEFSNKLRVEKSTDTEFIYKGHKLETNINENDEENIKFLKLQIKIINMGTKKKATGVIL